MRVHTQERARKRRPQFREADRQLGVNAVGGEATYTFERVQWEGYDELEDCVPQRTRSRIEGWSRRSRNRMLYRLATIDWLGQRGIPEMVTLTYPREFPSNGRVVKRHFERFCQAWRREYGALVGCWKLEFQRRGAPHFHLYCFRPVSGTWHNALAWARRTWAHIVGSGDPLHEAHGVNFDRQFCSKARSSRAVAWYFSKHQAHKSYQNRVPDGYTHVGRFWGVLGVKPETFELELTTREFCEVRRVLVRLRRAALHGTAARGRVKARGRLQGHWALVDRPSRLVSALLRDVRFAGADPPPVRGRVALGASERLANDTDGVDGVMDGVEGVLDGSVCVGVGVPVGVG